MRVRSAAQAIGLVLPFLLVPAARADDGDLCRTAIGLTERASFIPDRLMQAIGIMESGRRGPAGTVNAWPWTINVEGVGEVFETKQAAIAAVLAHQARGARSIDVGCMQINLMHHGSAFASLDQAFDPAANTRYAATFLQQLLAQTGSWPRAVGGYHSLTPDIGGEYAKKVLAIWARPEPGKPGGPRAAPAPPATPAAPPPGAIASASPPASMPSGMAGGMGGGRLISAPGSATSGVTGRGLDSYRMVPTRLATSSMLRRS